MRREKFPLVAGTQPRVAAKRPIDATSPTTSLGISTCNTTVILSWYDGAVPTPPPSPPPLTAPSPSPSPSSSASPGESPSPSPAATGLTVSPTTVALHPNGTATIAVSGATGIVSVTFSQNLATAKVDPVSDIVTVNAGAQTGTDTVHIADAAGNTADVPLRVALDAGTIPSTLTLKVTGSPVDPTWLAAQIEAFITRMMTVQPGAQATVTVPTSPAPLVGESVQT